MAPSFRIWSSSAGTPLALFIVMLPRACLTSFSRMSGSRWVNTIMVIWVIKTFFPRSHVQIWKLDHREGLALKNGCFWIVLLEKTLKSPLPSKEIKSINPKGSQPWMFIGMTDDEAPILWSPDAKSELDAGKDWGQEEKGLDPVAWEREELWMEVHNTVQEVLTKTIPKKKKCKKAKWWSEEALQTTEKRREAKGKGEKERYTHWMQSFRGEIGKPS